MTDKFRIAKAWAILATGLCLSANAFAARAEEARHETLAPEELRCPDMTLAQCTATRVKLLKSLSKELRDLAARPREDRLSREDSAELGRFNQHLSAYADRADALSDKASSSSQDLMNATQQMQEMQMSFNLQYLMLQENMQDEAREYTAMSNIMKTRYDTMKGIVANLK